MAGPPVKNYPVDPNDTEIKSVCIWYPDPNNAGYALPMTPGGSSSGPAGTNPSVGTDGAGAAQPTSATQLGYWNGTSFVPVATGAGLPVADAATAALQTAQAGAGLKVQAVAPAAGTGTDSSNAQPTVLTTLKSGAVAHAGQLYVQNQSAATIQLILNPGSGQTIVLIDPGAASNRQGGDWSAAQNAPWFLGSFTIAGAAGSQIAAIFN